MAQTVFFNSEALGRLSEVIREKQKENLYKSLAVVEETNMSKENFNNLFLEIEAVFYRSFLDYMKEKK